MTQVAVDRQIWNYQEIGSGEGTPLLILHGWGRSGNEWVGMAKELSGWSGRKAYVVDLPGFGGSSLPKVKNIHEYSELVVKFCEYLGIKKVVVIGHSLGGRVGIVMASQHSDRVQMLILIDPAGVKPRSVKRVMLRVVAKLFGWVPKGVRAKLVAGMMDEDYRNSPTLRELYKVVVAQDLRRDLTMITSPVELIWGEHDPILPLSLSTIYRQLIPQARLRVVWGAGHDPHLTLYEQALRILQESVE